MNTFLLLGRTEATPSEVTPPLKVARTTWVVPGYTAEQWLGYTWAHCS